MAKSCTGNERRIVRLRFGGGIIVVEIIELIRSSKPGEVFTSSGVGMMGCSKMVAR